MLSNYFLFFFLRLMMTLHYKISVMLVHNVHYFYSRNKTLCHLYATRSLLVVLVIKEYSREF